MTRLRQMMLDELERRNYAQNTKRAYLHAVADFARHFPFLAPSPRTPRRRSLDGIRIWAATSSLRCPLRNCTMGIPCSATNRSMLWTKARVIGSTALVEATFAFF